MPKYRLFVLAGAVLRIAICCEPATLDAVRLSYEMKTRPHGDTMKALSIIAVIAVAAGSASTAVAQQKTAPARPKSETGETCTSTDGKVECRKIVGAFGA